MKTRDRLSGINAGHCRVRRNHGWLRIAVIVVGLVYSSLFATVCTASATVADAAAETVWKVGVAKADVTPDYPIRLNGFAVRKSESEGTSQKIWARALAIEADGQGPIVLITLDSLGIRLPMVDEVARRVAAKTGLARERLVLTFTHTHSAPKVNGASDNIFAEAIPADHQAHIDRYTTELTDALEQVALAALADRQPATLAWSVGRVGFAKNRRTPGGPVDHQLPVLIFRGPSRDVRVVYTTYACHCVTLSQNLISGDWAGYAVEGIERHFPGATAMVSIGCGSDQNPISGVTGDKTEIAEQQGLQIADEVNRLVSTDLRPVTGPLTSTLTRIELPFRELPTREQYEALAAAGGAAGYNALTQLARMDRGESLPKSLEYPIQTLAFGDSLCMVFLGGEVCVDYSLRLQRELHSERLWLHGYSNDFGAYIPSERLLQEGGYGGGAEIPYFALPTTLKPGLEQRIVDEVLQQVPSGWKVATGTNGVPPRSPAEALATFTTHSDLRVELVAAEPQVADPVAIDFGPDGRLWVAEMIDYARGVEEEFEPSGQIRLLSDANGDGQYDGSTVFLNGLRYPTDVKCWRRGVLVCDAPDILYAEDSNADGRADIRNVLFTGFATLNGQARVNSLQWGLDGWVYGSCGLFGGVITSEQGRQVDVTGRDFRLKPDTGEIEAVTGRTQQSRVRDDWGNWFGCDNGTLIRHYPVYDEYARRNPFLAPPPTSVSVPSGPDAGRLFPPGNLVLFKLSGAPGVATAACGVGIYRDNLLGTDYDGDSFTCEPVNQLVYRQHLTRAGATFRGTRADNEQSSEFLSSTDQWFRPVQARTGPDGALWIVDMYRYVIEHPRWIPDNTLEGLNVFAGKGMGRIYRVVPRSTPLRTPVNLATLSATELATGLDTENGVRRDLIHQMLIWQNMTDAADALTRVVKEGRVPAGRVSALCALDGLGRLSPQLLLDVLRDAHPEVRRHAVRLSEPHFADSPELTTAVLKLADDPAFEVRWQLACSLGFCPSDAAAGTLVRLATESSDRYLTSAALSSLNADNLVAVVDAALSMPEQWDRLGEPVLTTAAGLGDAPAIRRILQVLLTRTRDWQPRQFRSLALLLDGLDRRRPAVSGVTDSELKTSARDLIAAAFQSIDNPSGQEDMALAAMTIAGRRSGPVTIELFGDLLQDSSERLSAVLAPQNTDALQLAALQALLRRGDPQGGTLLLDHLPSSTPRVRAEIVAALLNQTRWQSTVLQALESRLILPGDLDAVQRERLLLDVDEDIRRRAGILLAATASGNRRQLVDEWSDVRNLSGDPTAGREVFARRCAGCHKVSDLGHAVGPDLTALTTRTTEFLLTAILDPNRDVDGRYQGYVAVNDTGRAFAGLLVSETATSITLREQESRDHVLLRHQLEELRATGKSAMPEGLEKDLTRQDLASLIAWLQTLGPAPKSFPGNTPRIVSISHDGSHVLPADAAAIFGKDIAFESTSPYRNIGYWHGRDDHVIWTIQAERDLQLDVWLDYSCADDAAGNFVRLECSGQQPVQQQVTATGGWDRYRQTKIGTLSLSRGRGTITLRPADDFRGPALLDLRGLRLVPAGTQPSLTVTGSPDAPPADAVTLAAQILDDQRPQAEREQLIARWPQLSTELLRAMTTGLPVDETEEYRRIPWIWRVAIAAGKRNQGDELLSMIDLSTPRPGEPLRDWQAVVIGGGIVNGLSLSGVWPRDRLDRLIAGNDALSARWDRAIALSSVMADNPQVRTGTRYDALRMIAMESWDERGAQISRYLAKGTDDELQMGAISGMNDMPAAESGRLLLENLAHYSEGNRGLALDALLRTGPRALRLLKAVEQGTVTRDQLGDGRRKQLREHTDAAVRQRAAAIFKD